MAASLAEVATTFLRLGLTAFGGPAAHIAIFQREFVDGRAWVTRERFLDMLGASNLLPGPTSTEMAMGIGFERRRWAGLLVAGTGFILPASLIVLALAMLYERAGSMAAVNDLLAGMSPVVIAIIAHAVVRLAPGAVRDLVTALVGGGAVVLTVVGGQPLPILLGGALLVVAVRRGPDALRELRTGGRGARAMVTLGPWGTAVPAFPAAAATTLSVAAIFAMFLKLGLVVFGSGYVLLAYLQSELVDPGFITQQQLLDAVAIGQVTPGPVFTSATFIGYLLAGVPGAVAATVAIFLPSFVLVGLVHPFLDRIRRSRLASAAIDGLNAAAVGLIAATAVILARDAIADPLAVVVAAGSFALLVAGRLGPVPLLVVGALIGLARGAVA